MPLSWIYGKIIEHRNRRFESDPSRSFELGAHTVSIGNITAGGTGKTPLVILTADLLATRGKRVCILTRGYGRKNAKSRVLVSDGKKILADVANAGDEPLEMAKKLLGKAIVIADADRVAAAKWAKDQFGVNAFVLDDGFQHRQAKRDVDIVCIDAMNPFGGGKLLPSGRLREPLANLSRADAIVITRADLAARSDNLDTRAELANLKLEIAKFAGHVPVFSATAKMSGVTPLAKFLGKTPDTADAGAFAGLAHARAFAFCGLGNPESFFGQLRRDNFDLAGTHAFPDHYVYTSKDAAKLEKMAAGAGFFLTTAKDAVKLAGLNFKLPCMVLESEMVLSDPSAFAALL